VLAQFLSSWRCARGGVSASNGDMVPSWLEHLLQLALGSIVPFSILGLLYFGLLAFTVVVAVVTSGERADRAVQLAKALLRSNPPGTYQ
jgi:hypothetical protein